MAGKQFVFIEDEQWAFLPIWREVFVGTEWLALRGRPVYYGFGVPRGDGAAVITVPGFLGSDLYLTELNLWLGRIGYKPYRSNIGRNAECPDLLVDKLLDTIGRAYSETGDKVHLIGHSLGGILSRAAAAIMPDKILSVITMGSPFRGIRSHPTVLITSKEVQRRIRARAHTRPAHKPLRNGCFTGSCNCEFAQAIKSGLPEPLHQTAIYTKTDGIVDWRMCITGNANLDHEVKGTHCGLAWNSDVYKLIAQRLDDAENEHVEFTMRTHPAPFEAASVV
ncbi:MAG: alpha/beta fold hydrolase [Candidatus Hydrogenedentota bacterium]